MVSLGHMWCLVSKHALLSCAAFLFKNAFLFPLPTPYNVENQKKLRDIVCNIVWGVGGGARLGRLSCIRVRLLSLIVDRSLYLYTVNSTQLYTSKTLYKCKN